MRVRIGREALAEAVTWAARALPSRPVMPILAGLLLEAGEDDLRLSCFDYEVSAHINTEAVVAEPGSMLVPGRLLADIARSLPAAAVDLASDGDSVTLTCASTRFNLLGLPVEDFPALPALPPPAGTVDAAEFAVAVGQVAVAAGRDETLPVLTGMLIEFDGTTMTLVATDRYRMSVRELAWRPEHPEIRASALVPARTLVDASRSMTAGTDLVISLSPVGLAGSGQRVGPGPAAPDGLIGFDGGRRAMTMRLLGSEFVTYRSRFPREHACRAVTPAGPFVDAIRRVALVAERDSRLLLTYRPDEVVIETGSSDGSQAVETVGVRFEGEEGFAIAFRPQYLLDGIGAATAGTQSRGRAQGARSAESAKDAGAGDDTPQRQAAPGADTSTRDDTPTPVAAATGDDAAATGDAAAGGEVATGQKDPAGEAAAGREMDSAGPDGEVTLLFTTPDKPAIITGVPGFRYLLAPMRT